MEELKNFARMTKNYSNPIVIDESLEDDFFIEAEKASKAPLPPDRYELDKNKFKNFLAIERLLYLTNLETSDNYYSDSTLPSFCLWWIKNDESFPYDLYQKTLASIEGSKNPNKDPKAKDFLTEKHVQLVKDMIQDWKMRIHEKERLALINGRKNKDFEKEINRQTGITPHNEKELVMKFLAKVTRKYIKHQKKAAQELKQQILGD